jgi:O-antigen ligase
MADARAGTVPLPAAHVWAERLGVAGLYVYAFSAFFSTFAMNAGMQAMALAALLSWRDFWRIMGRRPVLWLALAFATYVALRGLAAGAEFPATRGTQHSAAMDLVLGNGLALLLASFWVGGQRQRLERALLLAAAGLLVLITLKQAWGGLLTRSLMRVTLDMSPNGLALIASILLWGSVVFLLGRLAPGQERGSWPGRVLLVALAALGALLLALTGSRAAWVASAVVIPPLSLACLWRMLPRARRLSGAAALLALLAGAGALGAWIGGDLLTNRLAIASVETGRMMQSGAEAVEDQSIGARLLMWQDAREHIAQRPLLGWGPGSARMLLKDSAHPEIRSYPHFHNLPLTLAVTLGIVGTLLYFAVPGAILWEALGAYRARRLAAELFFLALGGFVLFHLASLFQYRLGGVTGQFLLTLLGMAALAAAPAARGRTS